MDKIGNTGWNLIILFFSPLILMLVHMTVIRTAKSFKYDISVQLSLVLSMLVLNMPVLLATHVLNPGWSAIIYAFIVYNLLAYSYFHLFNMSETARRIKILLELRAKALPQRTLLKNYNADLMINRRLERLEGLKQVVKKGNKYVLSGRIMYIVAFLVIKWSSLWKKLLFR